jgi:two-component system sensor histidine kinase VanS
MLSRAERGAFTHEPVDLSLLAEEATETLLPLAEKRGVTITVSGEVAPANGSPALLLQLVTNVVHNAVVHNLATDGRVWVSTRALPAAVELVVENTGDRLSPALVATLTEPFQRGTERVYDDQAGVGLGLAIVQRIAEAHGGTLTLTPRDEGGLRVSVVLAGGSGGR